jgi:hypothetical protein
VRSTVKAGGPFLNHNEALQVRSAANVSAALKVRTAIKAGRPSTEPDDDTNHNETFRVRSAMKAIHGEILAS